MTKVAENSKPICKPISPRELEVIALVLQGLSNKQIADKLFVCEKTIKFHMSNIFKKVKVKSRGQLIAKSFDERMTEEEIGFFKTLLK